MTTNLLKKFQIPILNIGEELPQILLDIRSSQVVNWKSAVIVYDSIFGMTFVKLYQFDAKRNSLFQNEIRLVK